MKKVKNREHTIEFTKDKLDKTIKTVKAGTWLFAKGIEGLCLYVGKFKHTYYAHWGIKIVKPDGKRTTTGKKKKLGSYELPLSEIKSRLRANYDEWKNQSKRTNGASTEATVADLVKSFISKGASGQRIRSRNRLEYKAKTVQGYISSLTAHVLCEGKKSHKEYTELFNEPINFNGRFVTGALKDVPLSKIIRDDLEIYMKRMQNKPAAANNALAALSVAFEWDMTRSHERLYHGSNNPCLRVKKYIINKDKKFIDLDVVLAQRDYISNNLHKTNTDFTPHFLTIYCLLVEVGERGEDVRGIQWKVPTNILKEKERGATGYLDLDKRLMHVFDSKNRKSYTEKLTIEAADILKRLRQLLHDREDLAHYLKSPFVFPQSNNIMEPITNSSYRWQLNRFQYKFGLADRELVRKKKTRKLYKYKCKYTFKHLRKTFVTHYGRVKGLEAASLRMKHSSPVVTKEHYFTENKAALDIDHMYSPRQEKQDHKLKAVKGGKDD